jgi:single-stranded DNA-binding protein
VINVNNVELIGTVTCEPVFAETPNGTPVCKFIVETVDKFQDTTRLSKHNISAIGKLCDIIALHAKVGSKVLIRGRLEYWSDDKKNRLVDVRAQYAEFSS